MNEREYVSTTEAAKLLRVDTETLRIWGVNGKINIIVDSPKRRRVAMSDINRLLADKLPDGHKECTMCGLVDVEDKFAPHRNKCIECYKEYQKNGKVKVPAEIKLERNQKRYQKDKDNYINRANQRYKNKKDTILVSLILNRYNLSLEEYEQLKNYNDGKCYICNCIPSRSCVDHDHETGKVRGLLCDKCNSGIGFLKDDIRILKNAIRYLERFNIINENHCEYSGYYFAGKKGAPLS